MQDQTGEFVSESIDGNTDGKPNIAATSDGVEGTSRASGDPEIIDGFESPATERFGNHR